MRPFVHSGPHHLLEEARKRKREAEQSTIDTQVEGTNNSATEESSSDGNDNIGDGTSDISLDNTATAAVTQEPLV